MHFDIKHNGFADDTCENSSYNDTFGMLMRENDGPRRPARVENLTRHMVTSKNVTTTSSRPVNIEHSMEVDKPDTVAPLYREYVKYSRTENQDTMAAVYGSTLGNSPLATPSTGIEEQLSMDQYPSYERTSYMSMLKHQVRSIITGTSFYNSYTHLL